MNDTLSPFGQAAVQYVKRGRRVIPIVAGGKTPLRKGWHENTINTVEEAVAFWSENPDANLAFCPEDEGLAIIESDPGGDVTPLNLPPTLEIESPRGGTHHYFVGSVPATAGKLASHVDTRGRSSYVLIPPSVVNGKRYRVKAERDYAVLPVEIEAQLETRTDAGSSTVHETDLPGNIERAKARIAALIERGDVAIQGRGGDNRTYALACELIRDLGLSPDKAAEVIEPWNAACQPPWNAAELQAKLEHAAEYGQNEAGTYATVPASETFAHLPKALGAAAMPSPLRSVSFAALAERKVEPVAELIPGLIERGIATMLSGPGGTHKSRLALQLGLSLQAGIKVFGRETTQCDFWYLDYENGSNETVRRLHKLRYGLNLPAVQGRYFDYKTPAKENTGAIPDYETAPCLATVTDEAVTPGDLYYQLYDALRATPGHKFVVLDSTYNVLRFTSQAKINEAAVKAALNLLDHLCAATDSTILYLWHPSRAGMERGDASGWSVAWENTPRARLSISRVEDSKDAFTLKVEKRNNGPTGEQITLHWNDGTLLPVKEIADSAKVLMEACVELAVQAAQSGLPIKQQPRISYAHLSQLERVLGFRPTDREVKEQLANALLAKRLRYVKGQSHNIAGYYPFETDPVMADSYAKEAERERNRRRLARAEAATDQTKLVPEDIGEELEPAGENNFCP